MLEKIKRAGGRTIWPSNQNGRDGKPARVAGQPNKQPATGSPCAPVTFYKKTLSVTDYHAASLSTITPDKLCTKNPGIFDKHSTRA